MGWNYPNPIYYNNKPEPPTTQSQTAFECFLFWVFGGWVFSFGLAIIVLPKPNFLLPIGFYIFIGIVLFFIYLIIDLKGEDEESRKVIKKFHKKKKRNNLRR